MQRNLFIFEFISGGGFNKRIIPSSLFCEGFGMLRSIIEDFRKLDFQITTLLDIRIKYLSYLLNADSINYIDSNINYISYFKSLVRKNNFCFIIAPEFSKILKILTEIVKINKKKLLSIDIEGVNLGSSKYKTYKFFKKNKLETPETFKIPMKHRIPNKEFIIKKFIKFNSPIIIKPDDGIGAESILYFEKKTQIEDIFKNKSKIFNLGKRFLLQRYIEGKALSLSLISYYSEEKREYRSKILSINFQNIAISKLNGNIEYFGGSTPIINYKTVHKKISELLKTTNFSKFQGLFGIDLIQNENKISFIEINPRLTTSYLGLRNILNKNPAELIIKTKLNHMVEGAIKIENNSFFSRLDLIHNKNLPYNKIKDDFIPELLKLYPEFIVPPISLNNNQLSCFVVTKEKSLEKSLDKLNLIKNYLISKNFTIITKENPFL
ncbi:MAG: ATP-grasp domain-containing protein [Candidatus Lokiarchaeota archaeon]|nr:ATP-grasp domain-containing protein [Candidatus Lokiarchaeota archaeon]